MNGFDPRALALRGARLLACMVALALVACSDGGGGGPSLAVQSASATATTGGPAVALHATSGGSDTLSWSLAGPGALSATTGATVNYLPPDGEATNQAGTAMITVSAGTLSRQTQIAVLASTIAGHAWEVSRGLSVFWQSVSAGGSTFVATGYDGAIATSSDIGRCGCRVHRKACAPSRPAAPPSSRSARTAWSNARHTDAPLVLGG